MNHSLVLTIMLQQRKKHHKPKLVFSDSRFHRVSAQYFRQFSRCFASQATLLVQVARECLCYGREHVCWPKFSASSNNTKRGVPTENINSTSWPNVGWWACVPFPTCFRCFPQCAGRYPSSSSLPHLQTNGKLAGLKIQRSLEKAKLRSLTTM